MGGMISVITYANLYDALWEKPGILQQELVLYLNNILNVSL